MSEGMSNTQEPNVKKYIHNIVALYMPSATPLGTSFNFSISLQYLSSDSSAYTSLLDFISSLPLYPYIHPCQGLIVRHVRSITTITNYAGVWGIGRRQDSGGALFKYGNSSGNNAEVPYTTNTFSDSVREIDADE